MACPCNGFNRETRGARCSNEIYSWRCCGCRLDACHPSLPVCGTRPIHRLPTALHGPTAAAPSISRIYCHHLDRSPAGCVGRAVLRRARARARRRCAAGPALAHQRNGPGACGGATVGPPVANGHPTPRMCGGPRAARENSSAPLSLQGTADLVTFAATRPLPAELPDKAADRC